MHAYYLLFCQRKKGVKEMENKELKATGTENKKSPDCSGLVVMSGLEPPTHGFSVRCSTS